MREFLPHPAFLPHVACCIHSVIHGAVHRAAKVPDGFAHTGFGAVVFMRGHHHANGHTCSHPHAHTFEKSSSAHLYSLLCRFSMPGLPKIICK